MQHERWIFDHTGFVVILSICMEEIDAVKNCTETKKMNKIKIILEC